jgi:glucose/mannose-6-phosphate isomerase
MNPNPSDAFNEGYDRQGMLSTLEMAPEQSRDALQKTEVVDFRNISKTINSIVIAGMGGSAIGGILLNDWLIEESKIPIITSQNYNLPRFVDKHTLVIAVSYSGNTEETISALNDALDRGSKIITITSGGKLEERSLEKNIQCVKLPRGLQPRAALPYQLMCLAVMARKLSLFNHDDGIDEAIEILTEMRDEFKKTHPDNIAIKIAHDLKDHIPFIYGSRLFRGVAYRYSTQFNENSKIAAYAGYFPEAFHNAVMICEAPSEILDKICVLLLRDSIENTRIKNKVDGFKELLELRRIKTIEITARGKGKLARIMSTIYTGDYVSTYLGLLYGVDPSSVNAITAIKQIK